MRIKLTSICWLIGALLIALPGAVPGADLLPLPQYASHKHLGVASCANSLCHGAIEPWKESNILQNEYVTWSRHDKHAKAYSVLLNEESKRIARKLGLKKPAHESAICLDCHTDNIPAAARGERFQLSDGIGCEACHGGAEKWIAQHTSGKSSHQDNLKAGMFPTTDIVQRTRLCMSCHFGNDKKFVTHRIMGAGHPRMSFELDTFTDIQPAHFKSDSGYQKRKQYWDSVKAWAVGQALAVVEILDALTDPKRGRDGLFPELVLFDCHACHHPMSDKRWRARSGIGPGVVRLNDSNLLMLNQIIRQVDPKSHAGLNAQSKRMVSAVAGGNPITEAKALRSLVVSLIPKIVSHPFSAADFHGILNGLIDEGLRGDYNDYAGAEQATMAIGSVVNSMQKAGLIEPGRINKTLEELHRAVDNDERYRPERFVNSLKNLRASIPRK